MVFGPTLIEMIEIGCPIGSRWPCAHRCAPNSSASCPKPRPPPTSPGHRPPLRHGMIVQAGKARVARNALGESAGTLGGQRQ